MVDSRQTKTPEIRQARIASAVELVAGMLGITTVTDSDTSALSLVMRDWTGEQRTFLMKGLPALVASLTATGLVKGENIEKNVLFSASAPTINDDVTQGFAQGSFVYHVVGATVTPYYCSNPAEGAAQWLSFGGGGGGGLTFSGEMLGTVDGVNTDFTFPGGEIITDINAINVNINGVTHQNGIDFTLLAGNDGVAFATAPTSRPFVIGVAPSSTGIIPYRTSTFAAAADTCTLDYNTIYYNKLQVDTPVKRVDKIELYVATFNAAQTYEVSLYSGTTLIDAVDLAVTGTGWMQSDPFTQTDFQCTDDMWVGVTQKAAGTTNSILCQTTNTGQSVAKQETGTSLPATMGTTSPSSSHGLLRVCGEIEVSI